MFQQVYENYTTDDHEVWPLLYRRQLDGIDKVAGSHYKKGLQQLSINDGAIPGFPDSTGASGDGLGDIRSTRSYCQ
jgi:phenylalanine-4-hydroxylase